MALSFAESFCFLRLLRVLQHLFCFSWPVSGLLTNAAPSIFSDWTGGSFLSTSLFFLLFLVLGVLFSVFCSTSGLDDAAAFGSDFLTSSMMSTLLVSTGEEFDAFCSEFSTDSELLTALCIIELIANYLLNK